MDGSGSKRLCCVLAAVAMSVWSLVAVAAAPAPTAAATPAAWFGPEQAAKLDADVQALLKGSFITAAQYAVVDADGVRHLRTVGKMRNDGAAVDAATLLRQGSVSKSVTALALARLVEQGRLRWDTPLATLVPEVPFRNPWEASTPLTVLHLVEHTSGWDDVPYAEYAFNAANHPVAEYARRETPDRVSHWAPGLAFRYANGGPAVAGYVVEKVAGKPFDDAIEELVFTPLGMRDASFGTASAREARTTASYTRRGAADESPWLMGIRPSGSLSATTADMAALVALFVRRGVALDGTRVLSEAAVERQGRGETSWLARSGVGATYAKGQFHYFAGGRLWYGHWGKTDGFRAAWGYLPQHGRGFVLTVNALDSKARSALLDLLAQAASAGLPPAEAPRPAPGGVEALRSAEGWYVDRSPDRTMAALPLIVARPLYLRLDAGAGRVLVGSSAGDAEATRYAVAGPTQPAAPGAAPAPSEPAAGGVRLVLENAAEATAALVQHNGGWHYLAGTLYSRVAAWQVWGVRALLAGVTLMTVVALLWLPLWAWAAVRRKLGPGGVALRAWPLAGGAAALALVAAIVPGLLMASDGAAFARAGNPTPWSWGVFAISWLMPLAGAAALFSAWRAAAQPARVRAFGLLAGLLLLALALYFNHHGWIGIRTWRD
jgi:CubicO group peptidase (beta-lactamase class C family)